MSKITFLLFHIGIIIVAVVIILFLYPSTHHTGGMYLPALKAGITERADTLLASMNVNTTEITSSTRLGVNRQIHTHVLHEYGLSRGNAMLRDSIPAFFWDLRWRDPQVTLSAVLREEEIEMVDGEWQLSNIRMRFDGHGNLIRFRKEIHDTVAIAGVDADSARSLAEDFLSRFTEHNPDELRYISHNQVELENRSDHNFHWDGAPEYHTLPHTIKVTVAGSFISFYDMEYTGELSGTSSTQESLSVLSSIIPYVILVLMMLVIGIKRMRSQEIGFKNGVILGLIVAFIVGIHLYLQEFIHEMELMMLIPLLIGPLMIGLFIAFVVVVSEAIGRNTWKDKFIPYDLVSSGYIFHSVAGKSYIRGITYGIGVFAASLIIIRLVDAVHPVWYSWVDSNPLEAFSPPYAGLKILLYEFWVELIGFSMLVLFLVSYLRQRISNVVVLIIVAALLYGIGDWRYTYPTFPAISGILIAAMYGSFFVWILYRFDVVSGYLSVLTFSVAGAASTLLFSGNDYYFSEGIVIASVFGAVMIAGVISQFTRDNITDFEDIAPAFQKYISERERLQRELEIAHDVQMSFLPKANPDIPDIDVAATCIPAHEVGGDYYDFISINDDLFGVVIGDVSGKGTKASFYMTLTKGILRSTARNSTNPARVLSDVNQTFYESAERGAFISMVYGIFNLKKKTLTVARAGHNPVILWKSASVNGELINPKGIALGLDAGGIFNNSIQELTIDYEPGDVFVFYTDGFSEAVNKKNEEFGDKRLLQQAQKYNTFSAGEILNGIVHETNTFIGRTPQRDDMTMVVIKVK